MTHRVRRQTKSRSAHSLARPSPHTAHTPHTHCTHTAHTLHTHRTHTAHTLHTHRTHPTHTAHNAHTPRTPHAHPTHTARTPHAHRTHTHLLIDAFSRNNLRLCRVELRCVAPHPHPTTAQVACGGKGLCVQPGQIYAPKQTASFVFYLGTTGQAGVVHRGWVGVEEGVPTGRGAPSESHPLPAAEDPTSTV